MSEFILPILKNIFFNFDYFLIGFSIIIFLVIKLWPNFYLSRKIISIGQIINHWFDQLTQVKTWQLISAFFIINFIIRFLMAFFVPDISLDKIGYHYLDLGKSLYYGQGFNTAVIWNNFLQDPNIIRPDFFRLPLYSFLISIFYHLFGLSYLAAELVNVIAGSLLPILAYSLAYLLTKDKKIATLLLILTSFNRLLLSWTTMAWPEIIYCCTGILALYFLYKTREKNLIWPILVGGFWALTYLSRAEALYIFLLVIIFYYFLKQDKKQLLVKISLTIFGFLIIASPYLARNYILTGNPLHTDFDKIVLVAYLDNDRLVESLDAGYQNIYDYARQNPTLMVQKMITKTIQATLAIPSLLIYSYAFTILILIGIIKTFKNRDKYYYIYFALFLNILIPVLAIGFEDRYHIIALVLFYLFAAVGIIKIYEKSHQALKSTLTIYLFIFIIFNALVGIGKGTLPFIPHSFYARFDADKYFTELKEFYDYVKNNTGENDVIMASRRPYEVNYFTGRPVVIFPYATTPQIQQFMTKYQVKWVIWMGTPSKEGDKYYRFWLPEEIPQNIKPVFKNTGGDLFLVESYPKD